MKQSGGACWLKSFFDISQVELLPPGTKDGRQGLQVFFTVPRGAAEAVTCLVTYDQGEEDVTYFNGVSCLHLSIPPRSEPAR